MFGPEDRFLNWIGEATERLPFTPLVNGGSNLVQPVYSVDVGKALMAIVYVSWAQFCVVSILSRVQVAQYFARFFNVCISFAAFE